MVNGRLKLALVALLALTIASASILHHHSLIPDGEGAQLSQHLAPVCPTCAIGADRIVLGFTVPATPLLVFYTHSVYEPAVVAAPSRRVSVPRGPPSLLA